VKIRNSALCQRRIKVESEEKDLKLHDADCGGIECLSLIIVESEEKDLTLEYPFQA